VSKINLISIQVYQDECKFSGSISYGKIDIKYLGRRLDQMTVTVPIVGLWIGIASLVFGVIVMIFPKILNYLVGIYLIIIGVLAIIQYLHR
jgi:uncharacterized membrane protein HdeD (DUF308 family)